MPKFDIEKLIKANTNDGEVDYTKINESLEEQNRNIVVKEATKEVEKLKGEQLATIIKEIGVDGESIEDLKLYIKTLGGSTDEVKEEKLKLEKLLKETEAKLNQEVETRTTLEKTNAEAKQLAMIKGLGIEDAEQVNYLKWKLNSQVTEDKPFDIVFEEYKKENDITVNTPIVKDVFGFKTSDKEMDIGDAWQKQRSKKRK